MTYGFKMAGDITDTRSLGMMKEIEEDLNRTIRVNFLSTTRPPDMSALLKINILISQPKHNYVVNTQKNCLYETIFFLISKAKHMLWVLKKTVLLSTQNKCLN